MNDILNNKLKKDIYTKKNVEFWTKNPSILLDSNYISQLWINNSMSKNEKLNALSRIVIFLTLITFIFSRNIKILITGIVTLIIIIYIYYSSNNNEGFANINYNKNKKLNELFLNDNYFTQSTIKNPLSNVQLPQISDDPKRKEAPPSYSKEIEKKINTNTKDFIKKNFNDENIDKKLFNDLGDNLQFENSMRQFYSTSSTTIPNDQEAFLKFCYDDMISCRDGDSIACSKNNFRHIKN